uniref:GATA zinc finger domain-containing protein 8-like n=1 Tax=Crassostrea virginica TaxID=6565 RepID=A0A8B8BWY9_CRAVI|nr:GATA zinc finger domain-containing protein 8-like [Crassostrea virginica]
MSMPPQPQVYQPPPPPWPQQYTYPPYPQYPYTHPVPWRTHVFPNAGDLHPCGIPECHRNFHSNLFSKFHNNPNPNRYNSHNYNNTSNINKYNDNLNKYSNNTINHNYSSNYNYNNNSSLKKESNKIYPKPAHLDVVHSEILESTKIDGKEDWDAFKLKFNSQGVVNSPNEFEDKTAILTTSESSEKTDHRETGREVDDSMCFASGSVTKSVLAVEVNNASKSDSNMYDRTVTITGRELVNTMCFASDSVTKSVLAVEVNNASKSDSNMYDRTVTITGRELVNTMCFASDSVTKSDPPVEVNNASETQSDRLDGATRVAWGAAIKDLPWRCLVVAFLDVSSRLRIPSGLPYENKCWSVPWLCSHL